MDATTTPAATPTALPTGLRALRLVGFLEGLSSVGLFFIAMPLKYLANKPEAVREIGMIHGILFLIYVVLALAAIARYRWAFPRVLALAVASLIPCGPFFVDHRIPRWYRDSAAA